MTRKSIWPGTTTPREEGMNHRIIMQLQHGRGAPRTMQPEEGCSCLRIQGRAGLVMTHGPKTIYCPCLYRVTKPLWQWQR